MNNYKKKVVGTTELLNPDGDPQQVLILSRGAVDKNFTKIFHEPMVKRLKGTVEDVKYMKKSMEGLLMFHQMIGEMGWDNHLRMTQGEIAKKIGRNVSSVKRFIQGLEKADILMCIGHRDYMFSPELVCKVGNGERQNILNEWFRRKGMKQIAQNERDLGSENDTNRG